MLAAAAALPTTATAAAAAPPTAPNADIVCKETQTLINKTKRMRSFQL